MRDVMKMTGSQATLLKFRGESRVETDSVVPSLSTFFLPQFQLPVVNHRQEIENGKFQK
jgi:hypothetical protein